MASTIKGRSLRCRASVGAIIGAAAALAPASCGTADPPLNLGGSSTGGSSGTGGSGTRPKDAGEDSTLVDLDSGADAAHDGSHGHHDADIS